ncbi:MAG: hypothetical protein GF418_06730 [Chitinivibrionales bacterium]|nr:hypothetical protein [Chitinivibrionales bacterium]MBD3395306.1 hypothetical protein [Chitinivibrionales bacterium]
MQEKNTIHFKTRPILVAAWPGMGQVGLMTVDYLRRKLNAKVFAGMDMTSVFVPESIVVKDGIAHLPDTPESVFHYHEDPDIIVFESNAQLAGKEAMTIAQGLLKIAAQFHVSRIYTAAAFAKPMSHNERSEVLFVGSNDTVKVDLEKYGLSPMPDGMISGLNGLLLGLAGTSGIEAGCFLGTIPSYSGSLAYPKAALEILTRLTSVLGVSIDLSDLEEQAGAIDRQLGEIEDRIRQLFPSAVESSEEPKDETLAGMDHDDVPKYIMDKIERLFEEVARDRSRAVELKNELVRWNLYDLYEKRFLELFRDDMRRE